MVERPQAMELTVITLVERRGRWLVHAIGPMAYVFCPQASRDLEGLLGTMTSSAEPYLVGSPRPATVTLITLVLRRGRWLI